MAGLSASRGIWRSEGGQVVVLVAILMTALLAALALVVDVGATFQGRRRLQGSADAAALAAAMELAEGRGRDDARTAAQEYAGRNGPYGSVVVSFQDESSVRVALRVDQATFVAKAFGRDSVPVGAAATARIGTAGTAYGIVPFAVPKHRIPAHTGPENAGSFELGDDRPLSEGGEELNSQEGYFWLVNLDAGSGGVPDYRSWIADGYPNAVTVGASANGTGVKATLGEALEVRMGTDPDIVVPVYDYTRDAGSGGVYHVVGFAEFHVNSYQFNGNPKSVSGYFTSGTVVSGTVAGGSEDFGAKVIWLTE